APPDSRKEDPRVEGPGPPGPAPHLLAGPCVQRHHPGLRLRRVQVLGSFRRAVGLEFIGTGDGLEEEVAEHRPGVLDTPRVALPRPEKAVARQVAGREGAAFAVRDGPRPRRQGLHSLTVEIAEVLLPPAVLPGVLVDADGDVVLPGQATAPGVETEPP